MKKKQKQPSIPLTPDELEIMQNYNRPSFWNLIGTPKTFMEDFEKNKKHSIV